MFIEASASARIHALAEWPREACGVVVRGTYIGLRNLAADSEQHFQVPGATWLEHGRVEAVIHSHCAPRHGRTPSGGDLRGQIETAVPWGIVLCDGQAASGPLWWGDFRLDDPLFGREYLWGISDCWSVVRSWHWQRRGVKMRDFPRDEGVFLAGADLIAGNAEAAGLLPIADDEVMPGDIAFLRIRGTVVNHCAVADDGGMLLHHLPRRLSCRQPVGMWRGHIVQWLRHTP